MVNWNYQNEVLKTLKQIEEISDEKQKQKVAYDFIQSLINEYSKDYNFLIERFLEIDSDIILINVPKTLMDSLKESIFCYVNGQYLSTIASVGITSELFCVYIYELFLKHNPNLDKFDIKKRLESFSNISQFEKIDTLFAVVGISEKVCQMLHAIRKIRNVNVHPHIEKNYKSDALESLQILIQLLNSFSEEIIQSKN